MSSALMKTNKTYRQGVILKLIRNFSIHTQEQLAEELESEGIKVTQVTLSRDMRDLGLVKTTFGYREPQGVPGAASTPHGPRIGVIAGEFLLEARVAQNLVVLKTSPGSANSLASALDYENWDSVVGTIAGDDTVLVVTADHKSARDVADRLLDCARR